MKKLLYVLFLVMSIQIGWSQATSDTEKTVINQHIEYINHCNYYIAVMRGFMNDYNGKLNEYYRNSDFDYSNFHQHFDFKVKPDRLNYDLVQRSGMLAQFEALATARNALPATMSNTLRIATEDYALVLDRINTLIDDLTNQSAHIPSFFSDKKFKNVYLLLENLEKQVELLAIENEKFYSVAYNLYGQENLPLPLMKSKKIVALFKEILDLVRNDEKEHILIKLQEVDSAYVIKGTLEDLEALEAIGDFDPYGRQASERQNIQGATSADYKWAKRFALNQTSYTIKTKEDYLIALVGGDSHGWNGIGQINRYNKYIERAEMPIMKFVDEVKNFYVRYPAGFEKIEDKTEPIIAIHNQPVVEKSTRIESDSSSLNSLEGALTNNLVLLLDVSRSMKYDGKFDRLKMSIVNLIEMLRVEDKLTVITYSEETHVVFKTNASFDKNELINLINDLKIQGKTNGKAGLKKAYDVAQDNFIPGGNNRVIIATDGEFKLDRLLERRILEMAAQGIKLSTLHYIGKTGKTKHTETLQSLKHLGKGNYIPITKDEEAVNALMKEAKQLED